MAISPVHSSAHTDQPPRLDLVLANQQLIEPICSWRLMDPLLECKIFREEDKIRYSVYNHFRTCKTYWPNYVFSPTHLTSVFTHCVWKKRRGAMESRLFSDGQNGVLVSIDLESKKIGIKQWMGGFSDFLLAKDPLIVAINDDDSVTFQEQLRETPRSRAYDPEAEEGMIRWRRTPQGELVSMDGELASEETKKVWPGPRDIRLIKFICKQREEILFRVFSWESKKNPMIPSRMASGEGSTLHNLDLDTRIEQLMEYTPTFDRVQNIEEITLYEEHPLNYFMPDYVLSRTKATQVQRWVYEQFYRIKEENRERFEYTNFVSAKKIAFSFGKGMELGSQIAGSPELETWHVTLTRQAAWALQLPIAMSEFFSGIFLQSAQNPPMVDKKAMERFIQGVPLFPLERNKIADDFAIELGKCSTINFYIACDRSISQLEIDGRAWVRSFANAGRDVRGAAIRGAEGVVHLVRGVDLAGANRAIENAADLLEEANKLRHGLQVLRGVPKSRPENG